MSRLICSVCHKEDNARAMKSCLNCGSPLCSECYSKNGGYCNCTAISNIENLDII